MIVVLYIIILFKYIIWSLFSGQNTDTLAQLSEMIKCLNNVSHETI